MASSWIPLTGADCFLRAFNAQTQRYNGASHLSQVVLHLGPGFDPERFRKHVERVVDANAILRAPIARPLGVGAPAYDLRRAPGCAYPVVEVCQGSDEPAEGDVPEIFFARLNALHDQARGELIRFDVVPHRGGARTDLAVTWLHMLFDGSGSEKFLRWLDATYRGVSEVEPIHIEAFPAVPAPRGQGPPGARERGRMAMSWQRALREMGSMPPRSLAGPLRRVRQELRFATETFSVRETADIVERAKQKAGVLTPVLFYLACALRAHHAVYRMRGADPGAYVVPLPVNLRPKGQDGSIFGTHVSVLWFQVLRERVDDLDALIEDLKVQRRHAIRDGRVEGGAAALDYARYMPSRAYAHMTRRNLRGELCSFFFAFTDQFLPGLEALFDAPLLNGFHTPSVPASPGTSVVASIRAGRLNVAHIYQQGVFAPEELEALRSTLRDALRGA